MCWENGGAVESCPSALHALLGLGTSLISFLMQEMQIPVSNVEMSHGTGHMVFIPVSL